MLVMVLFLLSALPFQSASASEFEPLNISFVAVISSEHIGTWESTGLVTSSGEAFYEPLVAGWDQDLGIFRTGHELTTFKDNYGEIHIRFQAYSDVVVDNEGNARPGYHLTWVIVAANGAYEGLRGQGKGTGWPDFGAGVIFGEIYGLGHYEP
jgi:hypothetical protein